MPSEKIRYFSSGKDQIYDLFWNAGPFKKVLYIGAQIRNRVPSCLNLLQTISSKIDCLEIFEPIIKSLRKKQWFNNVYLGDIFDGLPGNDYDLIFWWHGPEHLERKKALFVIDWLYNKAPYVWIACPWGNSKQGMRRHNIYERHLCALTPEDFPNYNITLIGKQNKKTSNIIAYNRKGISQ